MFNADGMLIIYNMAISNVDFLLRNKLSHYILNFNLLFAQSGVDWESVTNSVSKKSFLYLLIETMGSIYTK